MSNPDIEFQTLSTIRRLVSGAGIRTSRRRGQNFLIDRHAMERLVACAELTAQDLVLEVGTGTGGLTVYLVAAAGYVTTVEIDRALAEVATGVLGSRDNLELIVGDVLRTKHQLAPEVAGAVRKAWESGRYKHFKLVANLPYVVATPVVADLLRFEPTPERLCFTVQKELADRMLARAGTAEYGWLSVMTQSLADVYVIAEVAPTCFWPRPQVRSAIMRVVPKGDAPRGARLEAFTVLVSYLFQHRRKTLLHNLRAFLGREGAGFGVEMSGNETRLSAEVMGKETVLSAEMMGKRTGHDRTGAGKKRKPGEEEDIKKEPGLEAELILKRAGIEAKTRAEDVVVEGFWRLTDEVMKSGEG